MVKNWKYITDQLRIEYRTYDESDYTNFLLQYNYVGPFFQFDDYDDFGKVNVNAGGAKSRIVNANVEGIYVKTESINNQTVTRFLVSSNISKAIVHQAGAPKSIWIQVDIPWVESTINFTLQTFSKTATRLPEAMFLRFIPSLQPREGNFSLLMYKLGERINPAEVLSGGGKHQHSISSEGLVYTNGEVSLTIQFKDSPIVTFGEPNAFPTPLDTSPDFLKGLSFNLWNNLWGTNYIMYYPYNLEESDLKFRFYLKIE